jgi:hypothetical protein
VNQAASGDSRGSGDSGLRWWVLVLAAIAVSSSYYNDDVIGPIADLLHRQRWLRCPRPCCSGAVKRVPTAMASKRRARGSAQILVRVP